MGPRPADNGGDGTPGGGPARDSSVTDLFCLPEHIEAYARATFTALATEKQLRGLVREDFVGRLTHYYAEVNAIHPFREGNGRTQRAFFRQLARQAGWHLDWEHLDAERNRMASKQSLRGNNQPLSRMLDELLTSIDQSGGGE